MMLPGNQWILQEVAVPGQEIVWHMQLNLVTLHLVIFILAVKKVSSSLMSFYLDVLSCSFILTMQQESK